MQAMKVFVTGATGFIGGRMTRLLAERGDEVTITYVRDGETETADVTLARRPALELPTPSTTPSEGF